MQTVVLSHTILIAENENRASVFFKYPTTRTLLSENYYELRRISATDLSLNIWLYVIIKHIYILYRLNSASTSFGFQPVMLVNNIGIFRNILERHSRDWKSINVDDARSHSSSASERLMWAWHISSRGVSNSKFYSDSESLLDKVLARNSTNQIWQRRLLAIGWYQPHYTWIRIRKAVKRTRRACTFK
jgi:hypothetical protein